MGELAHLGYVAVGLFALLVAVVLVVNFVVHFVAWVIDGGWIVLLFVAWIAWGLAQ